MQTENHKHSKTLHAEKGETLRIHVKQDMVIEINNMQGGHSIPVLMETPGGTTGTTNCGGDYTCAVPSTPPGTWKAGDVMYFTFGANECPCHPRVTLADKSVWNLTAGSCSNW